MATLQATNKTIVDAITPSTVLSPGKLGGNVRCLVDKYTGLGTESANDTIEFGTDLPKGATILNVIVRQVATGTTVHVGDAEDPNRYIDTAADNTVTMSNDVYLTGVGYEITDLPGTSPYDSQILVTLITGAVTAAGTIDLIVLYTAE